MYDEFSKTNGDSPGVITGKPLSLGGSLGRDSATGRGALFALDHIARAHGWTREKSTSPSRDSATPGRGSPTLADQLGYRVVAVSDSKGAITNPEGLSPREVADHKRETGSVVGFKQADDLDGPDIIGVQCEVLVPAALEESIRTDNADRVRANLVVEVANYPITRGRRLADRARRHGGARHPRQRRRRDGQLPRVGAERAARALERGPGERPAAGADGVGDRRGAGARERLRRLAPRGRVRHRRGSASPRPSAPAAGADPAPYCVGDGPVESLKEAHRPDVGEQYGGDVVGDDDGGRRSSLDQRPGERGRHGGRESAPERGQTRA